MKGLYPVLLILAYICGSAVSADIFVVPDYRTGTAQNHYNEDADFAHWLGFDVAYTPELPPYEGLGWQEVNHPFYGGNTEARIGQYGAPGAIITSNLGIYSYTDNATAFYIYDDPSYSPGTILFQTQTYAGSQTGPDFSSVQLFYRNAANGEWLLSTLPLNGIAEGTDSLSNFYTAWEWDTSSLFIYDYYISFAYELAHSSISQAQLDTNETYVTSLDGYNLTINTNIFFGISFGLVQKTPEKMVYEPGEEVTISVTTNSAYTFAKWTGDFGESLDSTITITMDSDQELSLIIATRSYYTWRALSFSAAHGGGNMTHIWAKTTDYDEDGRNNWLEYALGGNPERSDNATYGCFAGTVKLEEVTYPTAIYNRQIDPSDLDYTLECSTDLVTWKDNGHPDGPFFDTPERLGITDSGAAIMQARLLQPVSEAGTLFVRLSVSE